MKNPFYSIIIPVYKAEKYLADCLDSVLRQSFKDFEVILIDDGSPDSSPDICDDYAARDNRITVIHKEKNEGVVRARNAGLQAAGGEYIVFVDSDDWIDSDMLLSYRQIIGDGSTDFVISKNNYLETAGKTVVQEYPVSPGSYSGDGIKELTDKMLYSGTFYEYYINPAFWGKAYKRELLVPDMLSIDPDICVGEDLCCVYTCMFNAKNIYVCKNKGMYHYRSEKSTSSREYRGGFLENGVRVFSYLDTLVRERGGEGALSRLDYSKLYAAYSGAAFFFSPGNGLDWKEKFRAVRKLLQYSDFHEALHRTEVKSGITSIRRKILSAMRRENLLELFIYICLEKIFFRIGLCMPKNGV